MENIENLVSLPGGDILFARLAYNLLESGDVDEATTMCEKGLKIFPTYAQAHYILAKCYMKKNMVDEARAELERVLRYDPNHLGAIKDLSGIHFSNGFQDLYKEYLQKLYTLDPLNEEVVKEVKQLGEYDLLTSEAHKKSEEERVPAPGIESEKSEDVDDLFIETEADNLVDRKPEVPDKIDLSQFDNLEDDFTTILHGKLEYPTSKPSSKEENTTSPEIDKDLFGTELVTEKNDTVENEVEEVSDVLGEQELVSGELGADTETALESVADKTVDDEEQDTTEPEIQQEISSSSPATEPTSPDTIQPDAIIPEEEVKPDEKVESQESLEAESTTIDLVPEPDVQKPQLAPGDVPEEEEGKFQQTKIISQTLGEILVSQKKYTEAKAVFEALKEKQPKNKSLDVKIAFLDKIIGLEKEN